MALLLAHLARLFQLGHLDPYYPITQLLSTHQLEPIEICHLGTLQIITNLLKHAKHIPQLASSISFRTRICKNKIGGKKRQEYV